MALQRDDDANIRSFCISVWSAKVEMEDSSSSSSWLVVVDFN